MGRRMLERIAIMRFEELLERFEKGSLSHGEAAAALGLGERTFRRWRQRYAEEGADGLVDRRVGRPSPKRAPADELERMLGLYQEHYQEFTIKHCHEKLVERHGYKLGYTTTRLYLQKTGAVQPAPRRGAHRRKRPRRPMRGMMLHQDASKHRWLADQPALDLVITMDDATSTLTSAFLVEEEGTQSSFRGLVETIERHGLFMEFYTDRGSHYFFTPEAGGKVSKTQLTQVGRALKQLGIGHIAAYSPQARGRCERAFRTLQDRLPKELALAEITTVEAANEFLREVYLPAHNTRFAVPAAEPASAFVVVPEALWRDVLCIQEERRVGNDNCVRWQGRQLQIPASPLRPHLVRATVRVHDYPDGTVALFKGPQHLASFPPATPPPADDPTDQVLAA
jgi:transposase